MESIFWRVISNFLPWCIYPNISRIIFCFLPLNFQLAYFKCPTRTCFRSLRLSLDHQSLYVDFPKLWTYCILFQRVDLSLNVFILWLGLLVWIPSLKEELILTGVSLASSYQCCLKLKGGFKHRSWQDRLKLNHIWLFYSKDVIFAIKYSPNQTYPEKSQ